MQNSTLLSPSSHSLLKNNIKKKKKGRVALTKAQPRALCAVPPSPCCHPCAVTQQSPFPLAWQNVYPSILILHPAGADCPGCLITPAHRDKLSLASVPDPGCSAQIPPLLTNSSTEDYWCTRSSTTGSINRINSPPSECVVACNLFSQTDFPFPTQFAPLA